MESSGEQDRGGSQDKPLSEPPPQSMRKPTLAGIRNSSSHPPKRITKSGLAPPPATDSDPPPPMMDSVPPPPMAEELAARRRELAYGDSSERGSYPPRPGPIEISGDPNCHDGSDEEEEYGEFISADDVEELGDEIESDWETIPEIPRAPALPRDHKAMIAASEEATPIEGVAGRGVARRREEKNEKNEKQAARSRYKTVPGGGRNRVSGGRESASLYVRPDTLRPSQGRVGTNAGIRLDSDVIIEARTYPTEPSLLVRRASSQPPPLADGYGEGEGNWRMIVIVLLAVLLGGGAVWTALSLPPPGSDTSSTGEKVAEATRQKPEKEKEQIERNEEFEGPKQEVKGKETPEASPLSLDERSVIAPAPRPRRAQKARPKDARDILLEEALPTPSARPKEVTEEPWLE